MECAHLTLVAVRKKNPLNMLLKVQMALNLQIREDSSHLGCESVALCLCITMLLKNVQPLSSRIKNSFNASFLGVI